MTSVSERVFIVGGTGNVGAKTVRELIDKKIPVTLYARTPEKVHGMFKSELVKVVQGDYEDLSPLKEGLRGHTRLFLLIADLKKMVEYKKQIALWAYEAGVQQVVDISSAWVSFPWRSTPIGTLHYYSEKAIFDLPNRGSYVTLRPGRFMSNLMLFDGPQGDRVLDVLEADAIQGWISPNDIGAVAAVVLSEEVEKHHDAVYELSGDLATPAQRTDYLSRAVGRPLTYQKITAAEKYDRIMSTGYFKHTFAYCLAASATTVDMQHLHITDGIEILLRRKPETLEQYILANKDAFK
ncbi:hypothetical protein G6F43_007513 [Rhizopus delemar]|nr:hypothetical protein G6F43_007513 [Rhizopus delemar]